QQHVNHVSDADRELACGVSELFDGNHSFGLVTDVDDDVRLGNLQYRSLHDFAFCKLAGAVLIQKLLVVFLFLPSFLDSKLTGHWLFLSGALRSGQFSGFVNHCFLSSWQNCKTATVSDFRILCNHWAEHTEACLLNKFLSGY